LKGKYIFLGIAISFFIIAYIQYTISSPLTARIYVTVALVSVNLSVLELLKTITQIIQVNAEKLKLIYIEENTYLNKSINLFEKYKSLKDDIDYFKCHLDKKQIKENKIQKYDKTIYVTSIITTIFTILQIVMCTVECVITQLYTIPYDDITNQFINITTLVAFGFMFLTYFVKYYHEEKLQKLEYDMKVENKISTYYLSVIEKIITELEEDKVKVSSLFEEEQQEIEKYSKRKGE